MRRLILFAFILVLLTGPALAQEVVSGDADAFRVALEKDGFIVQKGGIGYFDLIKVYNAGVFPSAYGNNPGTKYLLYFVPPAPGHQVPELFAKIAATTGMSPSLSSFWNIGPDEAVIFVGRTPPECRYFSYDHYLVDRTYGTEARWIFANVADTLNNLVINTEGTPDGSGGNPFNQTTVIVTTADKGIDQRIRAVPALPDTGGHHEHPGASSGDTEHGPGKYLRYLCGNTPPGSVQRSSGRRRLSQ